MPRTAKSSDDHSRATPVRSVPRGSTPSRARIALSISAPGAPCPFEFAGRQIVEEDATRAGDAMAGPASGGCQAARRRRAPAMAAIAGRLSAAR